MGSTLAPGLARKVTKALNIKLDSIELTESLETLSEVYPENTTGNRRKLRTIIEQHSVDIHTEFLTASKTLVQALHGVESKLTALSDSCKDIGATLRSSKTSTAELLHRTDSLTSELETVQRKECILHTFLDQYQLSTQDSDALRGEEVDDSFFAALRRVHAIHSNCRTLLRTHHQRAGLELMDAMAAHQEAAYERLCRWVQVQCHSMTDLDMPDVSPLLQSAAQALRERPVLFRYCAEEVATARHNAVFQNFLTALTQGGPGGMPRPIEIHAHNPRRYVSDMFAWVHQAVASEKELLVLLFGNTPEPGSPKSNAELAQLPQVAVLLDKVFEGICRPLKVRVEQVLLSSPTMLLCFQLYQLLAFYAVTLEQVAEGGIQLTRSVVQVRDMAAAGFSEQMKNKTDKLQRSPPAATRDLSCPPAVTDVMRQLLEVVEAFEGSMNAGLPGDEAARSFDGILRAVLNPMLQACQQSAEGLLSANHLMESKAHTAVSRAAPTIVERSSDVMQPLPPHADKIFLINTLAAIRTPLALHRSCAGQANELQQRIEKQVHEFAASESERLMHRCGFADMAARLSEYLKMPRTADGHSMSKDPALSLPTIADKMRALFVMASSPEAVPDYDQVVMPRLRVEITRQVAARIASQYRMVYDAIQDPGNGYGAGADRGIKNTPEQIETVLGVAELS